VPKSPARACPFWLRGSGAREFDAYVKAAGFEEPTEVEADEPPADEEG
jgi:hypothetical protein